MSDGDSTFGTGTSGLEAGVQVGDFRIERRLGAGGMGIVYQARQISLNRPVALKVLGQALTRSADVSRFQREAQAAARLKHPSIAQVYFIGQDRHVCYLAMELIEGVSLRRVLDRLEATAVSDSSLDSVAREDLADDREAAEVRFDSPTEEIAVRNDGQTPQTVATATAVNPYLSPQSRELRTTANHLRRVCEISRDAAQALAHAHQEGVVHRDIKPDNLLLDRKGQIHLIDFGVARFFEDQAITYTGQLVGTPLYMSPEQVTGRGTIDARADIYSLGLVIYELLTLRPPIEATNRENLLRTIVTKPLPPVSWRNQAVSPGLEQIVHRATQKDPDQRYASAADFAADLGRYLAGQPVAAPPYHFRLDEREIIAARPSRVVLAAFICFVVSFFWFVVLASASIFLGVAIIGSNVPISGQSLLMGVYALAALGVGLLIGWGLLGGRAWARWIGVVLAALLALGSLSAATSGLAMMIVFDAKLMDEFEKRMHERMKESGPKDAEGREFSFQPRAFLYAGMSLYAIPVGTGFILSGTALWALLSWVTGRWFRFARDVRSEHRRLRQQLTE